MKMVDFDVEAYKYNTIEQITDKDIQRLQFTQRNVKLYAFNAVYDLEICGTGKNTFYLKLLDEDEDNIKKAYDRLAQTHSSLYDEFIEIEWERDKYKNEMELLEKENKQLKYENEILEEINEENKALLKNRWTEYLKKQKEVEEND